jgi:hypothetical protein
VLPDTERCTACGQPVAAPKAPPASESPFASLATAPEVATTPLPGIAPAPILPLGSGAPTPPAPPPGVPPPPPVPPSGVVSVPNVPPPPPLLAPWRYRAIGGLATALQWLLGSEIAVGVGTALASWHRRGLMERIEDGDRPGFAQLRHADDYVRVAAGLWGLLSLAIFVVLIVFLWRAAKNTELWRREKARYGPGWAIGSWFIPFANLVLPAMVVQSIWKRSPTIDPYGYRHDEPAGLVGWWWITWIVGSLLVRFGPASEANATAAEVSSGDTLRTVGVLFATGAALLLIAVVRRLAARQAVLARSGPAVAPTLSVSPGTWTPPV